jgi:sensor histidine kinase YesM
MEIISLEKEVAFLEDYLFINEKLRFEDRLRYRITVDEQLEDDILGVPTMIVQPYVENAIEHGLRSKKDGLVMVNFSLLDEDTILCVVEDNGIGRERARLLQLESAQTHRSRGTQITEMRLKILHHSPDKGVLVNTIDLIDPLRGEAQGTRVEIKIPILEIDLH